MQARHYAQKVSQLPAKAQSALQLLQTQKAQAQDQASPLPRTLNPLPLAQLPLPSAL